MPNTSHILFYEDAAQNIFGCVYDKNGELVNVVGGVDRLQPLPMSALVDAARKGFPFADRWEATAHDGVDMETQTARLEAQHHHICTICANGSPSALYPENATVSGKQFLIRWFF